jgi:outer membrane immunogenic protein
MNKIFLSLAALAAMTATASAADLPARTYTKAPPPPVAAYSWTGFYIFGGGGGGLWAAEENLHNNATGLDASRDQRNGGYGFLGTAGLGFDYQFAGTGWVAGVFGDGTWGNLRGSYDRPVGAGAGIPPGLYEGWEKLRDQYAVGVRVGYLVAPNVLSYVNGGWSYADWSSRTLTGIGFGVTPTFSTPSFNRNGWFVGGGVENSLDIFGFHMNGLFMKTEYRASYYDRISQTETFVPTGLPTTFNETFNPWVQTISTSLVYRFNWTGPVVAKY